jgi:hypothetical protein
MSLGHQAPEQRLGVALARTLLVIALITFFAWVFSKPEGGGSCAAPAAAADASPH